MANNSPKKRVNRRPTKDQRKSSGDIWLILSYSLRFWRLLLLAGGLGLTASLLAPIMTFFFAAAVRTFFQVASPDSAPAAQGEISTGFSIGAISLKIIQGISHFGGGEGIKLLVLMVG